MTYINNENVPSILRDHYRTGLLSTPEFEKKAEEALGQLEVLRAEEDEWEAERRERHERQAYEEAVMGW